MLAVHLHVFFAKMSVEVFHPIFNPIVLSVVVVAVFLLLLLSCISCLPIFDNNPFQ